jgi:hypothetical protein
MLTMTMRQIEGRAYHQAYARRRPTLKGAQPTYRLHELDPAFREFAFDHMDLTRVNCTPDQRYDADTVHILIQGA